MEPNLNKPFQTDDEEEVDELEAQDRVWRRCLTDIEGYWKNGKKRVANRTEDGKVKSLKDMCSRKILKLGEPNYLWGESSRFWNFSPFHGRYPQDYIHNLPLPNMMKASLMDWYKIWYMKDIKKVEGPGVPCNVS